MLNQLTAILTATLLASVAHGQGTVAFITRTLGPSAQILDWTGVPVGSPDADPMFQNGQNFFVQLYAAAGTNAAEVSLVAMGSPVNIRNNANAGYVQESGNTVQGVGGQTIGVVNNVVVVTPIPGGPATVQVRAWQASRGIHYGDFWAGNHNLFGAGASPLLNLEFTGGAGSIPTLPVPLTGLQGFRFWCDCPPPWLRARAQSAEDISRDGFQFEARNVLGRTWRVEYSEDLIQWLLLSTNAMITNPIQVFDPGASNSVARFYRVLDRF